MSDTYMLYMASLQKRLDAADEENRKLKELLRDIQPLITGALYVNYKQTKAADEVYDRIVKALGEKR